MPVMKLKTKIVLGSFAIALLIAVATMIAAAFVIAGQNRSASHELLRHSIRILNEDLKVASDKLVFDTSQMATINNMGARIQFIMEEKTGTDTMLARDSYTETARELYRLAVSNRISKAAIYDRDGDLSAFVVVREKALLGFPERLPTPGFQTAVLEPGRPDEQPKWQRQNDFKEIPAKLTIDKSELNTVQFQDVDGFINLVAYAPVTTMQFDAKTEKLKPEQIGFAVAMKQLDDTFLKRVSELTRTEINLFNRSGFTAGTMKSQSKLELKEFAAPEGKTTAVEPRFTDLELAEESYFQAILPIYSRGECIGAFASLYSKATSESNTKQVVILLVAIVLLCLLLIIPIAFLFSLSITSPVAKVVDGLKDIAQGEGDLTYRLPVGGADELGDLARWFNVFIENLQDMIRKIMQNADQLDTSADSLSDLSGHMAAAAKDSSQQSDNVAAAAEEMSANMGSVAAAMEQTSTNIEMVASASEEMTATINEIAQNSEKARNISEQAVSRSKTTTEQVDELGRAAVEISQITEAINEISEQTNLLALNATIEAARAGDAGKGFAVVANEIKELARQTASATAQIKDKITKIQRTTEMTILQISEVASVINVVDEIVSNIAGAIEEQSATTKEIASNISQAARGILEVNKNVSQSSAVSEQIAKEISGVNQGAAEITQTSGQLDTSANKLSELAAILKEAVQRFKI